MWNRIIFMMGFLSAVVVTAVWVPKMNAQEASDWTKALVKGHCGNTFFDDPTTVQVCKGFNPKDAARIVGVLCLQF